MDYDGQGAARRSRIWARFPSPRDVSPNNSRSPSPRWTPDGWTIRMYSLVLGRMVSFPSHGRHDHLARVVERRRPARLLLIRSGDPEIWVVRCQRRRRSPQ